MIRSRFSKAAFAVVAVVMGATACVPQLPAAHRSGDSSVCAPADFKASRFTIWIVSAPPGAQIQATLRITWYVNGGVVDYVVEDQTFSNVVAGESYEVTRAEPGIQPGRCIHFVAGEDVVYQVSWVETLCPSELCVSNPVFGW